MVLIQNRAVSNYKIEIGFIYKGGVPCQDTANGQQ